MAAYLQEKAERYANDPSRFTTARELEIFVKHLKPAFKNGSGTEIKKALVACYEEAEELQLIKPGSSKKMHEFLNKKINTGTPQDAKHEYDKSK